MTQTSPESNWPGEREPSRHDVQVAAELPDSAFLSDFKSALLSSSDAADNQSLMHLDLRLNAPRKFTYPLAILSDFPNHLPPPNEVGHLREIFSKCYKGHAFLNRLPIPSPSRELLAPPFPLAIACLASVHARHEPAEARTLFVASRGLWGTIIEVDNREARSLNLLMTAILICIYASLSSDEGHWDQTGHILCSSVTIARRMRFHDPRQFGDLLGSSAPPYSGAFIWCLWLTDVVQALHFNFSVNIFTSRELRTMMPDSPLEFQVVYRTLLDDRALHNELPMEVTSQDDALLLLLAVISDILYLRGSLGQVVRQTASTDKNSARRNPFTPLSPHSELDRMETLLSVALGKWHARFHTSAPPDLMAFYHYCRMYLACQHLLDLPKIAGYRHQRSDSMSSIELEITERAVHHAWLVLDSAAGRSRPPSGDSLLPVWLPIVVFHAGLVVWAEHSLGRARHGEGYGSAKILLAFKVELEGMPWPCCSQMAATLERLMAGSAPQQQR